MRCENESVEPDTRNPMSKDISVRNPRIKYPFCINSFYFDPTDVKIYFHAIRYK